MPHQIADAACQGCLQAKVKSLMQPAKVVGEDVRAVGSDIRRGQLVLEQGELIGAAEVGILATVGAAQVQVQLHAI